MAHEFADHVLLRFEEDVEFGGSLRLVVKMVFLKFIHINNSSEFQTCLPAVEHCVPQRLLTHFDCQVPQQSLVRLNRVPFLVVVRRVEQFHLQVVLNPLHHISVVAEQRTLQERKAESVEVQRVFSLVVAKRIELWRLLLLVYQPLRI